MGRIFLSATTVMLFLNLHAQTNDPGKEIIYGRKDGVALTMLELKPDGKSNGKAIVRVIAGNWFSSFD